MNLMCQFGFVNMKCFCKIIWIELIPKLLSFQRMLIHLVAHNCQDGFKEIKVYLSLLKLYQPF